MSLITVAQAMGHLRLRFDLGSPADDRQADLVLKMAQAEAIVIDYCNSTAYWRTITPTWTDETNVPPVVQSAILIQFGELYRYRGDDVDGSAQTLGGLSPHVENLLVRHSDPVVK